MSGFVRPVNVTGSGSWPSHSHASRKLPTLVAYLSVEIPGSAIGRSEIKPCQSSQIVCPPSSTQLLWDCDGLTMAEKAIVQALRY